MIDRVVGICCSLIALLLLVQLPTLAVGDEPAGLELQTGDHICLVGSGLGERMQHRNHWEVLLHQLYPEKQLVVRNLCFSPETEFRNDFGRWILAIPINT